MDQLLGLFTLCVGAAIAATLSFQHRRIALIIWIAYAVRCVMSLVHFYWFPLPGSEADATMFENVAWQWAQNGLPSALGNFTTGAFAYSWLISLLYALTDRSELMMQGINVILGTWVVFRVHRLGLLMAGDIKVARLAALVVALYPSLVLYSAITLRETLVVFLILEAAHHGLSWARSHRLASFLYAVTWSLFGIVFHTGVLALLIAFGLYAVFSSVHALAMRRGHRMIVGIGSLLIFIYAGYFIYDSGWGLEKIQRMLAPDITEVIANTQDVRSRERTAYLTGTVPDSMGDLIVQSPARVVYFLFTPFPWWGIETFRDVIGLLDALFFAALFGFVWRGRAALLSDPAGRMLLALGIGAFALGTSNYGTAFRHRAKFIALLVTAAAVGYQAARRRRAERYLRRSIPQNVTELT
jgi:hypothetical protein